MRGMPGRIAVVILAAAVLAAAGGAARAADGAAEPLYVVGGALAGPAAAAGREPGPRRVLDVRLTRSVRIGLEGGARRPAGESVAAVSDGVGQASTLPLMASVLYEIELGSAVTPYVGAGGGMARVDAEPGRPAGGLLDDGAVPAYQLVLGVNYPVDDWLTLFGGYRFFSTDKPAFDLGGGARARPEAGAEYSSHSLALGVRVPF